MAIDILNIQPSTISKDLAGKFVLLAGSPKIGKTEFLCQCKDVLVCATEVGTNARPGAMVQPITTWSDWKMVCRQLERAEAKEKYSTIGIDTITILYNLCETYVCAQAGVQKIGEIPYGQGYTTLSKEFETSLRRITMLGYSLVMTCHLKETQSGDEENPIYSYKPDLNNRCLKIINGLVDLIGIITQEWDDDGNSQRYLRTRATKYITAGSRFKYLAPVIPFGYENLVKAVGEAIEMEAKMSGVQITDKVEMVQETRYSYNELRTEAEQLWKALIEKDETNAEKILRKAEIIFGRPIRLSEIVEGQEQVYALLVEEMREML